jgi:dTDP-4-dehydrorhamnose 3,5-epimerase
MLAEETGIADLVILHQTRHEDDRGFFKRIFCNAELSSLDLPAHCSQVNVSRSNTTGTLRGLHFQYPPHAEAKLVTCLTGAVFDVAVDLRPESPTFLSVAGVVLDGDHDRAVLVPERFAHGFVTLQPETRVVYVTSAAYTPASEDGIRFDDPALRIEWPISPAVMSSKDAAWPDLQPRITDLMARMRNGVTG